MEYVVAINRPKRGDIIPLIDVAEAMAKHASTAYGERTMHSPTLDAIRPQRVEMLMAAAKHGAIKVCSNDGAMGDAEALIQASPLPQFFSIEGVATSEILALHVTSQHLAEWGKATGNTFQVVNINGKSVEFGPLTLQLDGTEAGHYLGYVGGGEQTFYRLIPNAMWTEPSTTDLEAAYAAQATAMTAPVPSEFMHIAINGMPTIDAVGHERYPADKAKRNALGRYTMREAAEVLATAHGFNAAVFIKERMLPAFKSGELVVLDPDDGAPVRGRACNDFTDIVIPDNINAWMDAVSWAPYVRWPVTLRQHQPLDATLAREPEATQPTAEAVTPETDWRMAVQEEAWEHWLRLRASGCNQSVHGICDHMAKWCTDNNIQGGKKQNPRAGTIRNTVLGAGHWNPPPHSVAQAKAYIAQFAQTAQTKVA